MKGTLCLWRSRLRSGKDSPSDTLIIWSAVRHPADFSTVTAADATNAAKRRTSQPVGAVHYAVTV
jgi:hypothetical protein